MQSLVCWYQLVKVENYVLISSEMCWGDKGTLTKRLSLLHEAIHYKNFCSRKKKIKEFYYMNKKKWTLARKTFQG